MNLNKDFPPYKLLFLTFVLSGIGFLITSPVRASSLTFQGQNAGLFSTANPNDTVDLMNSVKKPQAPIQTPPQQSAATLVEEAVQSQISSRIYNDIFSGSAASGQYSLGNGSSISYVRANGYITITFTDPTNGTTQISLPNP